MAINILGIDHVVLRVRDVSAALKFYCDVLGCTIERNDERIGLIQLRAGQSLIDLLDIAQELGQKGGAIAGNHKRNLDHFALRIESFEEADVQEWLAKHGIDAHETKERYGAEGNGPSLYIEDPDGNVVELKGPARSNFPAT